MLSLLNILKTFWGYGCGQFYNTEFGTYSGNVHARSPHGTGTLVRLDGTQFSGVWDHGMLHGIGAVQLANGSTFEGWFVRGVCEGYGEFTSSADKSSFRGVWEKGVFKRGRFTSGDGTVEFDGVWKESGTLEKKISSSSIDLLLLGSKCQPKGRVT